MDRTSLVSSVASFLSGQLHEETVGHLEFEKLLLIFSRSVGRNILAMGGRGVDFRETGWKL